jgi:hypothetical protein
LLIRKINDGKILFSILKAGTIIEENIYQFGTKEVIDQAKLILDKKMQI